MNADLVITNCVIVAGLALVVTGALTRTFYSGNSFSANDKQAPLWLGRTVFIGFGAFFILIGFAHLFFNVGKVR